MHPDLVGVYLPLGDWNQDVKIDFESERVHRSEYDAVIKDPEKYLTDKMKIEQDA